MYIPNKFNKLQITSKQDSINQLIIYKHTGRYVLLDQSNKKLIRFDIMDPLVSRIQTDVNLVNGLKVEGPNYTYWEEPHPDHFQLLNNSKVILSLNISMCGNASCTDFTFTDKKDISFNLEQYSNLNPCIINYNANTIFYLTATSIGCDCPPIPL